MPNALTKCNENLYSFCDGGLYHILQMETRSKVSFGNSCVHSYADKSGLQYITSTMCSESESSNMMRFKRKENGIQNLPLKRIINNNDNKIN